MIPFLSFLVAILVNVTTACNPLTTNGCPAIPGLATSTYSVDFTTLKSLPSDWILADASNVTFSSKGAAFNFNKRKDAPYIWTNFYVAYGRIDVEMQVANGTGLITSSVMFSDDADEIDWEFSGSNLGAGVSHGVAQTNVFAKGITGNYDRGSIVQDVSPTPQTSFHTYTVEWTPTYINWIIDGVTKFTTTNNQQTTGNYQFPQTPSRLHIGMWDAGDPDTAAGTLNWAGGLTNYSQCPYVAYVRTVKITTPYPCKSWKYPDDFSGQWSDVQCTNETITTSNSASATTTSANAQSTAATYSVVAGDNGYTIADKLGCTFDQLSNANPGLNWDYLNIGQVLQNPNAATSSASSTTTSSDATSSTGGTTSSSRTTSTSSSSASASSTTVGPSSTLASCNLDECLNSMTATQHASSAVDFCSNYSLTARLAIPTYLSGCSGNPTRVKSACSCYSSIYATTTSLTTKVSSTGDTTRGLSTSSQSTASSTKATSSSTSSTTKTTSSTSKPTTTTTIQTTSSNTGWSNWRNAGNGWGYWSSSNTQSRHRRKRREASPGRGQEDGARDGRVGGGGRRHA